MNSNESIQFETVCEILLKNRIITSFEKTSFSVKVSVGNHTISINKNENATQGYRILTDFLNRTRNQDKIHKRL